LFARRELDEPVTLYQNEQCVGRGRIRNASRLGVLIEAERDESIHNGTLVIELERSDTATTQLRGFVVHRNRGRIGLMLVDGWLESRSRPPPMIREYSARAS
jgi:hypothetical protein